MDQMQWALELASNFARASAVAALQLWLVTFNVSVLIIAIVVPLISKIVRQIIRQIVRVALVLLLPFTIPLSWTKMLTSWMIAFIVVPLVPIIAAATALGIGVGMAVAYIAYLLNTGASLNRQYRIAASKPLKPIQPSPLISADRNLAPRLTSQHQRDSSKNTGLSPLTIHLHNFSHPASPPPETRPSDKLTIDSRNELDSIIPLSLPSDAPPPPSGIQPPSTPPGKQGHENYNAQLNSQMGAKSPRSVSFASPNSARVGTLKNLDHSYYVYYEDDDGYDTPLRTPVEINASNSRFLEPTIVEEDNY